jgi:hypothetical protein
MSNEARNQVDKILSNVGVKFSVTYAGTKPQEPGQEMDAWNCRFQPSTGQPYAFDFRTGLGLRKALPWAYGTPGYGGGKVPPRPGTLLHAQWQGSAKPQAPHPADVLHCLISDADGVTNARGFEDWCSGMDYDSDSRKAYGIYEACEEVDRQLRRVFEPEALQALREALQDY